MLSIDGAQGMGLLKASESLFSGLSRNCLSKGKLLWLPLLVREGATAAMSRAPSR